MEINSTLLHKALKYYYGYEEFRPGQEQIIQAILNGMPVLGILATGAGKSVCFQLPSLLLKGLTLVISPLISLMKDQAENLAKRGIKAAYLDSSMTNNEFGKALHNILVGNCKFLYVAPERLNNTKFLSFAKKANITFVAVDEAHCVSQWGRSFRKDYYNIPDFISALPHQPLIAAFTASATLEVRSDIIKRLNIPNARIFVSGFNRENLYFEVRKTDNKERELLNYLEKHLEEYGVVYCSTRKLVDRITEILADNGYLAIRYHAGLTPAERSLNQKQFVEGKTKIIVATNAFGMGIDKANVRFVIHYNMPKDIESYYQEAGRAGRDGKYAECILLFNEEDIKINEYLIRQGVKSFEIKKFEENLLNKMSTYCNTNVCLRKYMLNYFGEEYKNQCGNCGNCKTKINTIKRLFDKYTSIIM